MIALTIPAAARSAPAATDPAAVAMQKLNRIPVKGRAPKTGYSRAEFGQAWSDDVAVSGGHNGCDTRNDILERDLVDVTFKAGTHDCKVLTGTLRDPYTGKTIEFRQGSATSSKVQIDHLVALSDAWQKGAQSWAAEKRREFANDPRNLQAVDGSANQQKGDGDAATWLPENRGYWCTYVERQVDVKAAYGLWMTRPEANTIGRILGTCNAAEAPTIAAPAAGAPKPQPTTPSPTPSASVPAATAPSGGYANCAAARAAGVAPLHRGDPGYASRLDRDGDGIACE
ncbi:excalibur calcium-binding domain-containing protein [Tsukamurella sp. 8F]|uniref:GmrSD restriction endonuclease domain-containing protein n=1 Tax=unclassified Tsukamurella TaxID=2633480 RepID=UPI0023B98D78|nr:MULTISPECIES: DUF1524 domain-containing protein [unclassified Tsukamurella]MDF0531399.1 excalibur calcium-binding domain-containing protein [Tsukamurella sp. 8J]MDF0585295.1 excalibur calcium-binding domain-containing protein [Tsukamurella sp. 8F]